MKRLPALLVLALPLAACGADERAAAALYRQDCARCHGADGRGDPRSVQLEPHLDLTRSTMVGRSERWAIANRIGDGYQAMPGFSHRLEQDEIDALVDYTLRFRPAQGGK